MKQTAVEWYEKEINSLLAKYEDKEISYIEFIIKKKSLTTPAKKIENQQKMKTYLTGLAISLIMYLVTLFLI
jgi:hypothetical protein